MAVSKKVQPKPIDLSASLSMLNNSNSSVANENNKIQSASSLINEKNDSLIQAMTKDTQIIFRTTENNKNSLKSFFANYGFTLSKGIQLACFYLEQEIKAGNITIGPAGIVKK